MTSANSSGGSSDGVTIGDVKGDFNAPGANIAGGDVNIHYHLEPLAPSELETTSDAVAVVPQGLRPFNERHAEFFLRLLPGPYWENGLPESIHFWKTKIEETDADKTFRVGLIYGPSGCGKSSLVKAGLTPHLANEVTTVYVEATSADIEQRLLAGLRKHCRYLMPKSNLCDALARKSEIPKGQKVVLILDQFEQFLHGASAKGQQALIDALRECDGERLQCVLMVRDDFITATTVFINQLQIQLSQKENYSIVPKFDVRHAKKVLALFGQAYGAVDKSGEVSSKLDAFLNQAVSGLAERDEVICVRLSLFAQMIKGKDWTPAMLKEVGGAQGVGEAFLENSFHAKSAPLENRRHRTAAEKVLQALLPEPGTTIKGAMRSRDDLLEKSGYAQRPENFDNLIRILDNEIRLITPTDPEEGVETEENSTSHVEIRQKYYQLTHDYLVPSLRDWLTRKQKETRHGRAELRLAERSALWNAKPDNRHLPAWWEYLNIRLFTSKKTWTKPQRRMMARGGRIHGVRLCTALAILLVIGISLNRFISNQRRERAESFVDELLIAPPQAVPYAIEKLEPLRAIAIEFLQDRFQNATLSEDQRLHSAFALIAFGQSDDKMLDFVVGQVGSAPAAEFRNFESALSRVGSEATKRLAKLAAAEAVAMNNAAKQFAEATDDAAKSEHAAARDRHAKSQCRLAILLLHLGEESAAVACVKPSPDPKDHMVDPASRTTFIHEVFPARHGDIEQLVKFLRTEDPAFRAAMCLALGLASEDVLPDGSRKTLQDPLLDLYRTAADSPTHSAAGWTLRRWGISLPQPEAVDPGDERDWFVNEQGITLLKILAGKFTMGSEKGYLNEKPVHVVTLTKPFWLGDRAVTVGQFRQFVQDEEYFKQFPDERPVDWEKGFKRFEHVSPTDDSPVHMVSWLDSIYFCNWLTRRGKRDLRACYEKTGGNWGLDPSGTGYRLPSEAEWEYACRAGSRSEYCFGDDRSMLESYAVFDSRHTEPAGSKLPNSWGLFDMHGNAWEWCSDWYAFDYYKNSPVSDPKGPNLGAFFRVFRGGGWRYADRSCRSADRNDYRPHTRRNYLGFRVAAVQVSSK